MADFVQTMKDWQRMCSTIRSCNKCPMQDEDGWTYVLCSEGGISSARPEIAEKVITKWAADHPEPVYPTWQEWLIEIGVAEIGSGMLGIQPAIAEQPIPADTAEKLGLQPKEG